MTTKKYAKERRTWDHMIRRSTDPNAIGYHRYGGGGIRVCGRWRESFEAFLTDMGPCPSTRHSIDRIDNDRHYEPGNCRWATTAQQAKNKSPHVLSLNAFALDEDDRALLTEVAEHTGTWNAIQLVRYALRFLLQHHATFNRLKQARENIQQARDSLGRTCDMADELLDLLPEPYPSYVHGPDPTICVQSHTC